jgi:hypothetical protein
MTASAMRSRIPRWSALLSLAGLGLAPAAAMSQAQPALIINDVTVFEGNTGTSLAIFTVSFADPAVAHGTVTVEVRTVNTASRTATTGTPCGTRAAGPDGSPEDVDHLPRALILSFGPAETWKRVEITMCGDSLYEPDETFSVILLDVNGAVVQDELGQGTIRNDDRAPSLRIDDVTVKEGVAATFTVTITGTSQSISSVSYGTFNGTATGGRECPTTTAQVGDYVPTTGTLTFVRFGRKTQEIVVRTCKDPSDPNETFIVRLSSPVNATIANRTGTALIQ